MKKVKTNNSSKKLDSLSEKELADFGKKVRDVYEMGYLGTGRMMLFNLLRGIAYGFGFFIGGTILVAFLLYVLSQFDQVPLLQSLERVIKNSLTQQF